MCVCSVQSSEMAEKEALSVGNGRSAETLSAQNGPVLPSAGSDSILQDRLSFMPLESSTDKPIQPFPRSPKLQRKIADAGQPSQVNTRVTEQGYFYGFERLDALCTECDDE